MFGVYGLECTMRPWRGVFVIASHYNKHIFLINLIMLQLEYLKNLNFLNQIKAIHNSTLPWKL
jgi:hypothetical protein